MIISKRVERLYSLKEFENIKIVYEGSEDIGSSDPKDGYKKLTDMLWAELKTDTDMINKARKG